MEYFAWRDMIYWAWWKLPLKKRMAFTKPVAIGFKFYIVGYPASDLDNYIKGVKDALVRAEIIPGDTVKQVPEYPEAKVIFLCDYCEVRKNKKTCGAVSKCVMGFAEITINEL